MRYIVGPENAYNKKNENRTSGGSKEINAITREIINKNMYGTLCLILKSLKL
jgi:hypothetical protein